MRILVGMLVAVLLVSIGCRSKVKDEYSTVRINSADGFIDLEFDIASTEDLQSGSRRFIAKGILHGEQVGFEIRLDPDWQREKLKNSEESFYWGTGSVSSIGENTQRFVEVLADLYNVDLKSRQVNKETKAAVVGLADNPREVLNEKTHMKFFFNSKAEPDLYSEVFINVDVRSRKLHFNEKSTEYRVALLKSLTRSETSMPEEGGDQNQMNKKEKEPYPKSYVEGYEPQPFWFEEVFGDKEETRLVVYGQNLEQMRRLIEGVIAGLGETVDIMLKVQATDEAGEPIWRRWMGRIHRTKVETALDEFSEYFLRDGGHQFLVRDAETGSYLAFDEHGVLYLYGRHAEIEKQLEDLGFENRKDALITEQGHWHIEIADTDSIRDRIICQLQLLER